MSCLAPFSGLAAAQAPVPRPKLVLVIVIDQFRPDYLGKFSRFFGQRGFNLLLHRGAAFTRAKYEHAIAFTCPGHAVVLTGSYGNVNGIVSNRWYDQQAGSEEYCAADSAVSLIGMLGPGRSPHNLLDSTVGDVLKGVSGRRSRVITISGKDRAAIMMGGHLADAAYWTEDTLVVTSTYYQSRMPGWVRQFNTSGAASSYLGKTWERLLRAEAYAITGPDNVAAEGDVGGMGRTFPHRPVPDATRQSLIDAFETSPFHNDLLARFATQAVINERLGKDDDTDLLAIGFSANDLIGHAFGPDSHEMMDVTVRTDRLLEGFFGFLDKHVGLSNVLIVLTGDHGVAPLPEVMRKRDPTSGAGRFDESTAGAAAEAALRSRYGRADSLGWIVYQDFPHLYLNLRSLREKGIAVEEAEAVAKGAVEKVPGVNAAYSASELERQRTQGVHSPAELSFYPGRSGNILYQLLPYRIPGSKPVGTTHGSPWPYDMQVPILWFGASIKPGAYQTTVSVADIAPTLYVLLGVSPPSRARGRVLREMLD